MKRQQIQRSILSISGFLVLIGILIAVNFIASFILFRFDLTRNRIYSLSRFSKKLVRELEDPVIIKVYFSQTLPPQYKEYRKYLERLLDEYKVYSKGNVKVEFVKYEDPKKFETEAQRQGIPPLQFPQITRDKYEVQVGFMGLTIIYIDSREVIPVVKGIQGLEYDITSRIRKLVSTEKTKVGFLIGHGEVDVLANQGELAQAIQRDYEIKREDLQGATTVSHDIECLLLIGPEKEYSDTDLYAIDQFLMQGKPVGFFIGHMKADLDAFRVETLSLGIDKLIEQYGVKIQQGLVVDPQCQRIAISQRHGMFAIQNIVDFQYVPRVIRITSDNPMIKDLNAISFPFVNPLEVNLDNQPDVKATGLFKSSKHSWVKDRVYTINPFEQLIPPEAEKRKEHLLGVVLEGSWRSYYEKEKTPENILPEDIIKQGNPTRMIVVGTGGIFSSALPLEPENFVFFSNVLDWLTQDEGLIAIRSKGISYQAIGEISLLKRSLFKWSNFLLIPLCMAGFGVFRWRRRKADKEKKALRYKAGKDVG